ncbi:DNA/RNA nuclease SfsA [Patescibacteria group bacterium]|nr:DNA/RNA nuclease SfsA [Patescibacteria group bacterium]
MLKTTVSNGTSYKFPKPLTEGLIKSRPNRFIMFVELENPKTGKKKLEKCHCPSTGRIGNVIFENIPCLVSEAENPDRKTKYTVEAISLDSPKKKSKKWIGINQVKMNRYVEYFLKEKQFGKMIPNGEETKRERKLGNSRIDFQAEKNFIEVKMLLIHLPSRFDKLEKIRPQSKFNSFDRLIKHFGELGKEAKKNKSKAIILTCYQYDAKPFQRPKKDGSNSKILKAAKESTKNGVESWQANFKIDKKGIELIDYFKLKLF